MSRIHELPNKCICPDPLTYTWSACDFCLINTENLIANLNSVPRTPDMIRLIRIELKLAYLIEKLTKGITND